MLGFYRNRMYRYVRPLEDANYMAALSGNSRGIILKFDGSPMRLYISLFRFLWVEYIIAPFRALTSFQFLFHNVGKLIRSTAHRYHS